MEPVEINAGTYYLRQLRTDALCDDRPRLIEAFADPVLRRFILNYQVSDLQQAGDYVRLRQREWASDQRCSWAIAEPTTGSLLGEVGLKNLDLDDGHAEAAVWVHPAQRGGGVAVAALRAALRFGFGALRLTSVDYRHAESNNASASVARRCGFRLMATAATTQATGQPTLLWSKEETAAAIRDD